MADHIDRARQRVRDQLAAERNGQAPSRQGDEHMSPERRGDADECIRPGDTPPEPEAPYQPFPLGALPEPVRSYVDACAAAIGCDTSFVALPLLATLAGAIGNTRRVLLKRGWSEPAILWTAIIGESGTHKSPALDHARDFPRRR